MLMNLTRKPAAFLLGAPIVAATFALGAEGPAKMEIKTPSFHTGADIPRKYTCDGADVSPALAWEGAPAGSKTFALVADDPDAPTGTWVHWVFYDLPATTKDLAEGVAAAETLPDGAKQGLNDFRKVGYGGPCPPPGPAHRYFFKLYALDAPTNLKPRATKQQLLDAMKGHILAEAQLMGRYQRQ
jgi:Raf kinase inhibitor-like YbhB/YbcL family protein